MSKDLDKEIFNIANKIQWALGESLFRVKKLKEMLDEHSSIENHTKVSLNALLKSLNEMSILYRHDIAEKIRDQIEP